MSDYSSSIKKINDELLAFINRYEILDDKDPITNNLLKRLKKQINSLNTTSNQYVSTLDKQLASFDEAFQKLYANYKEEKEHINTHLNASLEVINTKYIKKINHLNEEINKLKKSSENKLYELEQDIEYFIISSKQREDIFEKEFQENIKRFDYQIASAKETYNQSIKVHNTLLEKNTYSLEQKHKNSLQGFDESTEQLVAKLKEKIDKYNTELNEVSEKLTNVRIQMKERQRQESIYLNNEIKILVEEKNKTIVNARTRYSKSQSTSSMEKENKRQEYQLESQRVLKDFVYNITELDEYTSDYKTRHNKNIEEENRRFQYKLFDIYKKQNLDINTIIHKGYCINDDYDKYTKHLIKSKNKQYYKLRNQLQGIQNKRLNNYELLYQKEIENTRHNKALLELDKNFSLKNLTEKEQSDNKYYQELNNIYENDMNLLIQISNLKYNQKANLVKCQSRIRNKGLEKDLDISEANFQKKIEMIQTSINKHKYEIEGALELKKIVDNYEKNNYKKNLNHLSVTTLLEIEKSKILDQFNHRQYQYNVLNSKTNLTYSKNKLEIENQQFEALSNIKIEKIKNILQRDTINAAYKIKEDQIYESEDKNIQNRNTLYELDSISHTVLYERFKLEIKIIHQILSTFILLVREIENFSSKVLATFFNSIHIRPEYLDIIKVFIYDFFKIVTEYYSNLISNLNEHECEVIYKRIEFEEKFKFKSYYNDLLSTYETDRKRLLTKKKSITDTLENYVKTVDTFKSRVYNLENQNNLIKQKMNSTQTVDMKNNYRLEYLKNRQKILDFKKKIEDILKFKNILDKDNTSISNELRILDKEYNNRVEEIKKMQYNSAISFYDLRRNLSKYSAYATQKFGLLMNDSKSFSISYYNLQNTINNYKNKVAKFNTTVIKEFFKIIHTFYTDTYESIQKDKRLLLIKFKHDTEHIYNKTTNLIEDNKKEYDKKVNIYIQELKALDNKYKNEEKRFKALLEENEKQYEEEVKEILQDKKESLFQFYNEYYAMCDNLEGINANFKTEMTEFENQFQTDKINLTKRIISEKNNLTSNLESFIKAKEELINHLPSATKFQSQQLNKETRDLNTEIGLEIKNAKVKFNLERKNIQKNISSIQQTLEQSLVENELKHQKSISKEKKNHTASLKHLESNITIYMN